MQKPSEKETKSSLILENGKYPWGWASARLFVPSPTPGVTEPHTSQTPTRAPHTPAPAQSSLCSLSQLGILRLTPVTGAELRPGARAAATLISDQLIISPVMMKPLKCGLGELRSASTELSFPQSHNRWRQPWPVIPVTAG